MISYPDTNTPNITQGCFLSLSFPLDCVFSPTKPLSHDGLMQPGLSCHDLHMTGTVPSFTIFGEQHRYLEWGRGGEDQTTALSWFLWKNTHCKYNPLRR